MATRAAAERGRGGPGPAPRPARRGGRAAAAERSAGSRRPCGPGREHGAEDGERRQAEPRCGGLGGGSAAERGGREREAAGRELLGRVVLASGLSRPCRPGVPSAAPLPVFRLGLGAGGVPPFPAAMAEAARAMRPALGVRDWLFSQPAALRCAALSVTRGEPGPCYGAPLRP